MKQFLRRMLLLALLCVPWVTNAQSTLTVADGTETNGYIPIYGFYNDAYNKIQILYAADSLTEMQGQSITGLTFYSANASGSWGSAVFTVKMAVVTETSLTDYLSDNLFTTCWEGAFTVSNGLAVIEFDSPFLYTGGNLVIQIWNTVGSYSSSSFYGVTLAGASIQNYNYNGVPSSGANARNFLPKTTFEYGTITCPKPTALTVAPNNDQATLSWTAGGDETSWIVYVNNDPVTMVSDTFYTMTNLTSNTLYDVAVRAFCGNDDTSTFLSTTFRSQCFDYTPTPYITGFEDTDDGELPSCWTALATGTSGSGIFPSVYDYSSNARNGDIYFEFESNSGQTEIAVLPPMEDINTLQLEFYASCMNTNFMLEVGVVEDDTLFVPVDTVTLTAGAGGNWHNSYHPYTVFFDQYSGNGENIAMRVTGVGSYTLMIDDISVTAIPDCLPPTHFVVDSLGINWVGLSWTDENGSSWEILYDTVAFNPANSTLTPVTLTDNYVVLTDLVLGMEYTAYLRGDCSGDYSPWVGPLTFTPGHFNMSFTGTDTLRGCGLTIYDFDGDGSDSYSTGANSMLVLYPSSDDSLIVFSGSTDIYSYYAHLRIYDGVGTNGTLLWQSSDYNETIPTTTSFSGPITIHFNAGSYNYGYTGFEIHTSCIAAPQCASVQNLQTPNVGVGSAYVTWDVSGLNLGVPTGYEVNCYDSTGTAVFTATPSVTNVMITGLAPESPYKVTIHALCDENNYGAMDSISFNTLSLACVEVDPTTSHFDTIGSGTSTSSYFPVYTCYNYSLSQQIYTASEFNGGGAVTGISFMPQQIATPNGTTRNIEIYLGHISSATASNFTYPSDLTMVYSGSTSFVADQWCEIVFDNSFNYNGSENLLVLFRDMTGNYTCSNYWYTHTAPAGSGASRYVYQDSGPYAIGYTGGTSSSDRMNAVFSFLSCTQQATCAPPIVVVDSIATDYVGISWGAGYQETSWTVEYRADTSNTWIVEGTTSNESWAFNNLATNELYHFRVGAICSDTTMYTEVSARTKCGSEALPFIYGFEDFPTTGYPSCWYKASNYSYGEYPSVDNSTVHGGSNSLYMYSGTGSYSYIVLPELAADIDTLELNFWMNAPYSNTNELYVGVMTDVENFNSFQNVSIVAASQIAVWEPVRVRFNNYHGNGTRIAIVSPEDEYVNMYIDDISVNIISPCTGVENVTLVNATSDSATIAWNGGDNANFEYVYGPAGFVLDTATIETTTFDTIILSNLTSNTQYDIYVRAICGEGDTSNWSNALSFRTDCLKITAVPFVEGFENNAPGWSTGNSQNFYPCWYRKNNPNDSYYYPYVYSYESHTGNYSIYWDWESYDNFEPYIALPAIDTNVIDISSMMLSFWAIGESYGDVPQIAIGSMTNPQNITTFQAFDTVVLNVTDWSLFEVPLNNYSGHGEYIAMLSINTGDYWSALLDDFTIDSIPSCMHVGDLAVTANTSSSVTLGWTELGSATSWEIAYGTDPTSTPVADTVVTGATTATIGGLTAGTTYYFWVRSACSSTEFSAWEGPVSGVPGSWNMRSNMTDTVYMCGGAIYDNGGPNGQYSDNQDNYVIIMPDVPGALVSVSGWTADESSFDYLNIYDGVGTSGELLYSSNVSGSYAGTFTNLVSSSGPLTLYFHSDLSIHSYDGFEVNVSCVMDNCPVSDLMLDTNEAASSSSLSLTWTGSSTSYEVVCGLAGFNVDTATAVQSTTTNSITIGGLNPVTTYDIYVRGLCNAGDTGMWHRITLSTALCDGATMLYNFNDTAQNASTSSYSPIGYSYYNYGYIQTIIDSAYLAGLEGDITAFAFSPASTSAGSYFTNITMWMANVSETNLSQGYIHPDSAHVFVKVLDSVDLSYTSTGWQIHGLDTVFTWDGHSNILVAVHREHGTWSSGSSFNAHVFGEAKMRYSGQDSGPYDYTTISGGSSSTTAGDIMLISCGVSCPKPSGVNFTNVSYSSATAGWNSNATDFEVAVKAANEAIWPEATPVTGNTFAISNLAPATPYQFRVRAICDATEGLISDWTIGTFTTDSLPCFAPSALELEEAGMNTATFSWTANGEENAWNIHVWNTVFDQSYDVTANPATVTGLTKNTTYYAAVQAICGNGAAESEFSDTISFTTADCPIPTGVAVNNVTTNTATVTWSGTAASYVLEYGPVGFPEGEGTMVNNITGTSYTLTGLNSSYSYDVYVMANCDGQNSSNWSEPVTFTTQVGIDGVDGVNVTLYPNPASQSTTVTLSGVSGEVTITIVDMNGRTVRTEQMSCEGDCVKTMEVTGLAQGAYFVRVNGDNVNMVKKLVVK